MPPKAVALCALAPPYGLFCAPTAPAPVVWLCPFAATGVKVSLCVEDRDNVKALAAEAARQGTHVDVLVEVNVGQDR